MSSGGVVGFRATPASQPPARISSSVRCRCVTTSGWTRDAHHPGIDERGDQVVWVGHLQVGVYGEVYGGRERGRDGRANGQVGDEVVVHHVEVDEFGAAPLGPPDLLGEVREIGREYRRGSDHPVAQPSEIRQWISLLGQRCGEEHSTERVHGQRMHLYSGQLSRDPRRTGRTSRSAYPRARSTAVAPTSRRAANPSRPSL